MKMRRRGDVWLLFLLFLAPKFALGVEILSKSKIEKCEKLSGSHKLDCKRKIVVNMAVPSGSSGGEASIVAELVEAEENATHKMQNMRTPPVITINKSAAYALYEITYIRDAPYKPMEYYVRTRKCEPDASSKIVQVCERLRDENGQYIESTQPKCCPCGPWRRAPSSCGNFFDKLLKGKANTAHCLRFPGDWFHIFGIGSRSLGFNVRVEVKKGSKTSEVIVGPENRTALSNDNLLRVNLIGDFVGYTSIPSFEDFYLVIPRQADQNRIRRNQMPQYVLEGRFERVNQHPNAGTHSFSIGITEALNTNLLIEINADDIEYVYQRSPGKILSVTIPTFEALTQFGAATITTKNIGKLEASYSLTFDCSTGVSYMEEQFFILKPQEIATRSYKVYPTTDQASKYECAAILKDSNFNEIDRAECQFTTTATILDNGSQIASDFGPKTNGINGFFESIEGIWNTMSGGFADFFTGKTCRSKCSSFFDFSCHIQYICLSWIAMLCLLLAIFPTVVVLLWLLHQKGLFDPLYDWWEDRFEAGNQRSRLDMKQGKDIQNQHRHKHYKEGDHHLHHTKEMRNLHKQHHPNSYHTKHDHHHIHGHKHRYMHEFSKDSKDVLQGYSKERRRRNVKRDSLMDEKIGHCQYKMERLTIKGTPKSPRDYEKIEDQLRKHRHGQKWDAANHKLQK